MPARTEINQINPEHQGISLEEMVLDDLSKVDLLDWYATIEYTERNRVNGGIIDLNGFETKLSPSGIDFLVRIEKITPNHNPSESPFRISISRESSQGLIFADYQLPPELSTKANQLYSKLSGNIGVTADHYIPTAEEKLRQDFRIAMKLEHSS